MDCHPPGSSVHGILQARILEWVAMLSFPASSRPRDRTCISCIAGRFFTTEPLKKPTWNVVSSVTQSCPTLCDPMNYSMPGLPVHHQLLEQSESLKIFCFTHWSNDISEFVESVLWPRVAGTSWVAYSLYLGRQSLLIMIRMCFKTICVPETSLSNNRELWVQSHVLFLKFIPFSLSLLPHSRFQRLLLLSVRALDLFPRLPDPVLPPGTSQPIYRSRQPSWNLSSDQLCWWPDVPWCGIHAVKWYGVPWCGMEEHEPREAEDSTFLKINYCSGFCQTLTWISHRCTCVPHPEPPSHLPPHPVPQGYPSAPALSTGLMHWTWTGDLLHIW